MFEDMAQQLQVPIADTGKKTLNLVQLMRAIASLLVVFFHFTSNTKGNFSNSFLGNTFFFGGSGVDIFFVISGFIITYTNMKARQKKKNSISFLERRIVRIYPIYWIIIIGFLLVSLLLPQYYNTQYDFTLSNLIGTFLLLPGHTMVNGVSWTLSFELYFYLIFILVFLIKSNRILICLAVAYIITILLLPFFYTFSNPALHMVFHPMIIEFFLGIAIVYILPLLNLQLARVLVIIGIAWFCTGAYLFNNNLFPFPQTIAEFQRVVFFGIPSFLIMTGIIKMDLTKNYQVNAQLVLLGEASYTLYLIHLPIVAAGLKLIKIAGISNPILFQLTLLTMVSVICVGSILIYKWIEKPIIHKLKRNRQMV